MSKLGIFFLTSVAQLSMSQLSNAQTAPTALQAEMVSNIGFEATWIPVAGINYYQIDVSTDPNFTVSKLFYANTNDVPAPQTYFGPDGHITQTNGAIWYAVPQLSASTKYYYRVRSSVGGLVSPNSNVIEVTTLADPPQVAPMSWVQTVPNAGGVAEVQSMVGDDDGNIYAAGRFTNSITVGTKTLTSHGGNDMFILKLAPDKSVLWAESIGGPDDDGEASLALDSAGLYLVAIFRSTMDVDPGDGTMLLSNAGTNPADGFYAKFKPSDGSLVWAHSLVDALPWSPSSIDIDKTGVYISGYFYGDSDLGTGTSQFTSKGENDVFFGKYDLTDGKSIWVDAIGGSHFDGTRGLKVGSDGVFVVGFFNGDGDWNTGTINDAVDFDPGSSINNLSPGGGFLAKYSLSNGALIYAKGFMGTSNFMCNPYTVDINKSIVYVAGNFHGTIAFGDSNTFQRTADDIGAFIAAYNSSDGSAVWVKTIQTVHFIHPRKIIADNAGLYLSGGFGQSVNFDPEGSANGVRTALIGYDNFMARYKLDGTFDWVKTLYVVSIAPAARTSDGYFLGGMFWNQVNFDPYQGAANLTASGADMFIAKYVAVSPPFAPKALSVSSVDTTSFTASWKAMPGATGYSLDISSDNFSTYEPGYNDYKVASTTEQISGLKRGATYSYRVRAENSYGSSDASKTVKVSTKCTDKPTIKLDETDSSKPTLVSSSSTGNQWFVDGEVIENATGQSLSITSSGSYAVQVAAGSCKSEISDPKIVSITGIKPTSHETAVEVYPNPTAGNTFLNLKTLSSTQSVAIAIFDVMGRPVKTTEAKGGDIVTVDLSNHTSGLYVLRAVQAEKHYYVKFIKQ